MEIRIFISALAATIFCFFLNLLEVSDGLLATVFLVTVITGAFEDLTELVIECIILLGYLIHDIFMLIIEVLFPTPIEEKQNYYSSPILREVEDSLSYKATRLLQYSIFVFGIAIAAGMIAGISAEYFFEVEQSIKMNIGYCVAGFSLATIIMHFRKAVS